MSGPGVGRFHCFADSGCGSLEESQDAVRYYIRNIALADGAVAQWYARGAGSVLVVDGKLRGYLEYLEDGGGPFGIGKKSTQFGM